MGLNTGLFLVLLVFGFGGPDTAVVAQIASPGICPNLPPMPYFNVTRYVGRWYEMEKYWFAAEATTSCATVDYSPNFSANIRQFHNVKNTVMRNYAINRFLSSDGSADVSMAITITQTGVPFVVHFPYRILATDYSTYTIKYGCNQAISARYETLWVLSKSKRYLPSAFQIVRQVLTSYGLRIDKLIPSAWALGVPCPDI